MANGAKVYVDRTYTYENVPESVQGLTYIQTGNGDQGSSGSSFLTFSIDREAVVYVAYNGTAPPAWLANNFVPTGETLVVAKPVQRMTFHLYARTVPAGSVTLGGNVGGDGSAAMYTVMLAASGSTSATVTDLQVASGRPYQAVEGAMGTGERVYVDRTYTYGEVPAQLQGETFIQTASGDQSFQGAASFLSFRIDRESIIYVAYDGPNPPAWLRDGFVDTGETLIVAKSGHRMTFRIFGRTYPAGMVTLGSNIDAGDSSGTYVAMYTVIVKGVGEPSSAPEPFVHAAAGYYHSCALDNSGRAYCWGYNTNVGQVGDNTTVDRSSPVPVVGGLTFRSLSGGGYHTCGVAVNNRAYCWGRNNFGQLGNGSTSDALQPVPVVGGMSFASIATGESHTCGLLIDGRAVCWGMNGRGQLGNGTTSHSATPILVQGANTFIALDVGYEHSCGLLANGTARCWGKNAQGQLGDGTRTDRTGPVVAGGGLTFATSGPGAGIKGGQNHTCAVTSSGQAYCWGDNWHNQIGVGGTRGAVVTPQPVPGLPAVGSVAVGGDHTCAVTPAGQAWCWGDNLRGQLGGGVETDYNSPLQVEGGFGFSALRLGWDHTCGVTPSGQQYCWGYNNKGQLGDGTRTLRRSPVAVLQPFT
jgi:alpha-tubulin suppressor-like RCC1 family protein